MVLVDGTLVITVGTFVLMAPVGVIAADELNESEDCVETSEDDEELAVDTVLVVGALLSLLDDPAAALDEDAVLDVSEAELNVFDDAIALLPTLDVMKGATDTDVAG